MSNPFLKNFFKSGDMAARANYRKGDKNRIKITHLVLIPASFPLRCRVSKASVLKNNPNKKLT